MTSPDGVLAIAGLVLGLGFGALVLATNFCTMGAVSDIAILGDWRRMRAWMLAMATAMVATQIAAYGGIVDVSKSIYLGPRLDWLGHLVGGGLFGVGMVLAGGCTSRNLARVGGGDARALVIVVVVGVVGAMAIAGSLAPARIALLQASSLEISRSSGWLSEAAMAGLGTVLAPVLSTGPQAASLVFALGLGGALGWICLASRTFRGSPKHLASGLGVGLLIALGWAVTGLAYDEFMLQPRAPTSLTFVRPTWDTLQWLALGPGGLPGFAIASVIGTVLGAGALAVGQRRFHLQGFAGWSDAARALTGAVLMGFGGVTALGCTIGQGLTAMAALAPGAILTVFAIIAGAYVAVRLLERLIDA